MRYSGLVLAAVGAALAEEHTTVLTIGYTNSAGSAVTAVTTYTYEYENPLTSLLTQTNSDGVITGGAATILITSQPPVVTSQPGVETSQPPVATIPAGLPDGEHTIVLPVGNGTGVTSFTVSVGPSTTVVLTPEASTTAGKPTGSGSGSGSSSGSPTGSSTSSSASSSSTGNAASGFAPASAGLLSLGALLAALF
ncbi:hypothetical protein GQ53DRAFT_812855 [Thozetella sp. PMI_491]|nr:hypothetical protein GQ53DRAFT_812855 [Thozetella sp. PMI_491]